MRKACVHAAPGVSEGFLRRAEGSLSGAAPRAAALPLLSTGSHDTVAGSLQQLSSSRSDSRCADALEWPGRAARARRDAVHHLSPDLRALVSSDFVRARRYPGALLRERDG